jgi:hypothetical protein
MVKLINYFVIKDIIFNGLNQNIVYNAINVPNIQEWSDTNVMRVIILYVKNAQNPLSKINNAH